MTAAASHPTAAELTAFLNGRLVGPVFDRVEDHVRVCPTCLGVLTGLPDDPLVRLAREAAQRVSVSDPTPLPGTLRAD
jgi:hypothetical protein